MLNITFVNAQEECGVEAVTRQYVPDLEDTFWTQVDGVRRAGLHQGALV